MRSDHRKTFSPFILLLFLLPEISSFIRAYSTGFCCALTSEPDTVTDTLVWIWIFCMAPLGQKSPTVPPSATLITMLSLHGCPRKDCLSPVGEASSTVPCGGGRRVQVTLLRGVGRQGGNRGTSSWVGVLGQSLI